MSFEKDYITYQGVVGNCPHCGFPIIGWFKAKLVDMDGVDVVIHHCLAKVKDAEILTTCPCWGPEEDKKRPPHLKEPQSITRKRAL